MLAASRSAENGLVNTPPELLLGLALPGKGGDNPAAAMAARHDPGWKRYYTMTSAVSAPSSTNVSMSTAVWMVMCRQPAIRAPLSGLLLAIFFTQGHEPRHLCLGNGYFLAAPFGQAYICYFIIIHSWFLFV